MEMTLPVKLSEVEFVQAFAKSRGAEVISAVMTTDPRLLRTGNPWKPGQILKRTKVNGMINVCYKNAVNNQREREGKDRSFVPAMPKWGTSVKGMPFKVHVNKKGESKIYLQVMVLRCLGIDLGVDPDTGETYKMPTPVYFDNETGETVPYEAVKPFLPAKSKNGRQGTEKEVIWRTPELGSLDSVNIRKLKILPKGWGLE